MEKVRVDQPIQTFLYQLCFHSVLFVYHILVLLLDAMGHEGANDVNFKRHVDQLVLFAAREFVSTNQGHLVHAVECHRE